ncbi:unnamed protein product, partial [Musa hybrid cultivar]
VHLLHRTVFLCFWSSQDLLPHSGSNCCLLESGGGDDDDDLRCGIDRQDSRRGCGVGSQESAFLGTPGQGGRDGGLGTGYMKAVVYAATRGSSLPHGRSV